MQRGALPEDQRIKVVIDAGLGRTALGRAGFQELVTLVTLGKLGILFAYDVTRLARNCADRYQLLELCGSRRAKADGFYPVLQPLDGLVYQNP